MSETSPPSTPTTPTTPSNTPANDGAESPATNSSSTSNNVKTVFLIRHAQSLENQRIASAFSCLGDIGRFSWPKRSDVGASLELLNISANHDAPLSDAGVKQCETMQTKLKECNFVSSHKVELVAHSPLTRAKQTCAELIGCSTDDIEDDEENKEEEEAKDDKQQPGKNEVEEVKFEPATPDTAKTAEDPATPGAAESTTDETAPSLPEPIQRVVSLNKLLEKTHMEWVPGNSGSFERRVLSFQNWLGEQPESVVCVVGHSQFFKLMLGMPFKFDNVDVYQVQFDKTKTTPNESFIMEHNGTADEVTLKPEWYDLKLLHTCQETPVLPSQEPTSPSATKQQQQRELQDVSANSDTML